MEIQNLKSKQSNLLILLGLILFFIGLAVGLFVQQMTNPRMGLSAHMQGITNGIFLIALGLIWQKIQLSKKWLKATYALGIFGTFANLLIVLYSAITGHGKMMPVAGGKEGTPFSEALVSGTLMALSLAMLIVCIAVIIGFYRYMKNANHSGI